MSDIVNSSHGVVMVITGKGIKETKKLGLICGCGTLCKCVCVCVKNVVKWQNGSEMLHSGREVIGKYDHLFTRIAKT